MRVYEQVSYEHTKTENDMSENSIITTLREEREKIRGQIATLEFDLNAITRVIQRFSGSQIEGRQVEMTEIIHSSNGETIGPTQAVRQLFDRFPKKKWTPRQIRDFLTIMKESGELTTETKKLLTTTHWLLKRFVDDEYIQKIETGPRKAWYRKMKK